MIVYSEPKHRFRADVATNQISERIAKLYREKARRRASASEEKAWKNSLTYMGLLLDDDEIADDVQVSIEYTIPQTAMRIDVILSGQDADQRESAVIVELKQWETAARTSKDAVVSTFIGGGHRERPHPSYQAWTYAALLQDFNETVQTDGIRLAPCAYLHNCDSGEGLLDDFYRDHLEKAPVFLRNDVGRLRAFIKQYVRHGDARDLIFRIEHGRIRPSKSLVDALLGMLQGKPEFLLIDDQKLVYETALALAHEGKTGAKRVLIVEGGPGTGKSVVAVNLLVELTARELLAQYVSPNAAPRSVYEALLTGSLKKSRITNLFRGSGGFTEAEQDTFDALIVDEAHRLTEKSGFYRNRGENQIKEVIAAARLSVFFIDEDQRVTVRDVGTKAEILRWAAELGAGVTEMALESQFRCNGSDGYLAWVDHALQVRDTANPTLDGVDYELVVCDSASALRDLIFERNRGTNKARLVAGYCWDWKSKKDPSAYDIELPGTDFRMKWNLDADGGLYVLKPTSVHEVGCIHTCQGLELDYVGVIVGPDLIVRDGRVVTDASARSKNDLSVRGLKALRDQDPARAREIADVVVKNTYRTLMTRGRKGCFVYCTDPETLEYFRAMARREEPKAPPAPARFAGLPLRILEAEAVEPYVNAVPVLDLRIAAGGFAEPRAVGEAEWVELPEPMVPSEGYFVAQVIGESMNRRIPNGSWCLFRSRPGGTRHGKMVLVQHGSIRDPDLGGGMTIKRYESVRVEQADGTWRHERIVLRPDSTIEGYPELVFDPEDEGELEVLAELVAVLG